MVDPWRARQTGDVVLQAPRRPSSIASAIGRGMGMAGQAAEQIAERGEQTRQAVADSEARIEQVQYRREVSRVLAENAGQMAGARVELQRRLTELRTRSAPGAQGHEDAVRGVLEEVYRPIVENLPDDPEIRERIGPMVAGETARVLSGEMDWELGRRVEHQGNAVQTLAITLRDQQVTNPDPAAFGQTLAELRGVVDGMDIDGTQREELWRSIQATIAPGLLDGMIRQGNADGVQAVLDSGTFDGLLGNSKDAYYGQVEATRRAQALEAERAASAARDAAREALDAIEARIDNGEDVSAAQIASAVNAAAAAGVPEAELVDAAYLGERSVHTSRYRQMNNRQLQGEVEHLREKQAAGGLSAAEQRQLDLAEKALGGRDIEQGDSVQTLWRAGGEGQQTALAQLGRQDAARSWAAANAASEPKLHFLSRLPQRQQQTAIEGARVRAADPNRFMPEVDGKPQRSAVNEVMQRLLGPGMTSELQRGGSYEALREAALDFYVGSRASANATGFSERDFALALRAASGTRRGTDGVYRGGIGAVRGRWIELPDGVSAENFERTMSGFDFAGNGARYGNGAAVTNGDVIRNYRPVVQQLGRDGFVHYRMEDAMGRALRNAQGAVFTWRVRR